MNDGPEKHHEGMEILDHDAVTTCLSATVHYMVCEVGLELDASYAVSSFVTANGEINWKTIIEHVQYSKTDQSVDYLKSVRTLGPLCESIHLYLQSLTTEQFEDQFLMWFKWTHCSEIFLEMFPVLKCPHAAAVDLSLMKLTSCLERALGDVFLLIGKDCPFLLRDLLSSWELSMIFGLSVMDVLRVFIGSPDGLNLRNILWHGFASPQEIPAKYSSMMLFLTAGLGQLLKNYLLQIHADLVHRPYVSFTNLKELNVFPDLSPELLSLAEELVIKSSIVLRTMQPFWFTALTSFRQHRYAECVMLLLPQLESGLRLLFTTFNKCPTRLLTAESSSLYTTFDEMLAKQLNHEEVNQLPLVLGESAMEHAFLKPWVSCANNFHSRFHPIPQLKKQVLQCVKSINLWSDLPTVPKAQEITGSEEDSAAAPCLLVLADIFSLIQVYLPQDVKLLSGSVNNIITEKLMTELCSKPVRILFCPRPILEITVVLRQIGTQCHQVSCQVISTCETRYKQWLNKSLRSRQRHNYLRLRKSIKCLSPVLHLILILITLELINIHTVCDKSPIEYQQYLKFLKSVLQYTENLVTYTSPEKNKWDETVELSYKTLIKIRTSLEKQLMLMQLTK